ncbi:Glycosyltransferase [hydrothermal vent metagenome]|uniref:Glycosyltransferase n=1 Tax=hydrothermal vent metagenome TaxID=652676 RepID=A0A3B0YB93_9ZZZZ
MKLLLVTNLFPTPVDPERGIFTLQLAKSLSKICDITVVCPLPYFPALKIFKRFKKYYGFSQVPYQYTLDNITVYSPKYPLIPKLSESKHAYLMSIALNRCINSLNKKNCYDIINSQWLYPDSCAVDIAIENIDLPHVATGLGCDINHDLYEAGKKEKITRMLNNANAITVVSNGLKNELIEVGFNNTKITVIANGVDIKKFSPLSENDCRESLDLEKNTPIILYVGRLSLEKCVSSLIKSAARLIKQDYSFNLYIVGDGPLRNELESLTEKLNIKQQVHFIGNVEHDEIINWMGACNYFCLPSLREGCPNVVLEALSCGRPVIASKVGAIPDVVSDSSGILFSPDDIDSICDAFKSAFDRQWDEKRIAESVKKLSWDHAAKKYIDIFNFVLSSQSNSL